MASLAEIPEKDAKTLLRKRRWFWEDIKEEAKEDAREDYEDHREKTRKPRTHVL